MTLLLAKKLNLNYILKRTMMQTSEPTSTANPSQEEFQDPTPTETFNPKNKNQQSRQLVEDDDDQDEIQQESLEQSYQENPSIPSTTQPNRVPNILEEKNEPTYSELKEDWRGFMSTHPIFKKNPIPQYQPKLVPSLFDSFPENPGIGADPEIFTNPATRHTDAACKMIVHTISSLGERTQTNIEKNSDLKAQWIQNMQALDAHNEDVEIKDKALLFKKWRQYSAGFIICGLFLFKMWQMNAVPDFLGVMGGALSNAVTTPYITQTAAQLQKTATDSTLSALSETPLSPLLITAGIGIGVSGIAILKILSFILRKTPR